MKKQKLQQESTWGKMPNPKVLSEWRQHAYNHIRNAFDDVPLATVKNNQEVSTLLKCHNEVVGDLRRALAALKFAKKNFAMHTTNSNVDDLLKKYDMYPE